MWGKEDVHISARNSREYIRSVILDRILRSASRPSEVGGHWSLKRRGEICWLLKWMGEVRWSLEQRERPTGPSSRPVSSSCVFCGPRTTSQKGSPPQKKDMCKISDCIPTYTQSSLSKNKDINYIFIYLRVFRCSSSGAVYKIGCLYHPTDILRIAITDGAIICEYAIVSF